MVGEAHLVGVADIFNMKYIIHECGRPPPGTYTYTQVCNIFRTIPNESISFGYSLKYTYPITHWYSISASLRNVRR